ncbi:MAG: hypothetical protein PHW95_05070 [Patescibacteria group bacterium]|nr:hypothetical protein [Patescibacteria group bacterium]
MSATHYWYVKSFVLPFIVDGSKDLELRFGHDVFRQVAVGDVVIFNCQCQRRIMAIREYRSLAEAMANEAPQRIYPGATRDDLFAALRSFLKGDDTRLGVLVFELQSMSTEKGEKSPRD